MFGLFLQQNATAGASGNKVWNRMQLSVVGEAGDNVIDMKSSDRLSSRRNGQPI